MFNAMIKSVVIACAGLCAAAASTPADAYNCRIPALIDPVKKAVCAQPLLAGMDRDESSRRAALLANLRSDARTLVTRDRRAFITTREKCASDTRCLEATYRAQLRLYKQLDGCVPRAGAQQTFCVSRVTQKHREGLHSSM